MRNADKRCVDCGARPPRTRTNYTLIERHGWRLTVSSKEDGRKTMEMRCPPCWAAHRAHGGISGTHTIGSRASTLPQSDATDPPPKKQSQG